MRRATITRKTNETEITVNVGIDGAGTARISTGIGFFDHMLDQIARHSLIDMEVKAKGDIHIDDAPHCRGHRHCARPGIPQALGEREASSAMPTSIWPWTRR